MHTTRNQLREIDRRLAILSAIGAVLIVLAIYTWFVTLGRWSAWTPTGYYYDRLATAFRRGDLSIEAEIDPKLLALDNPYDIESRQANNVQDLDIWDMSVYAGKLYMYFGGAPAFLLAIVKTVYAPPVGDAVIGFLCLCGLLVFEALILLQLWRELAAELRPWVVALGILVVGMIFPVPYLLVLPRIYETTIAAAQFFLVGGFFFALAALRGHSPSKLLLALAGTFWALAAGTRGTLAIPILFLVAMVSRRMWQLRQSATGPQALVPGVFALGIPLALGAGTVAWYNWARFGSVLETGLRYQVGFLDFNSNWKDVFAVAHTLPNLYVYFLGRPVWQADFPFIRAMRAQDFVARFRDLGLLYNAERLPGMIFSNPFGLLGAVAAAASLLRRELRHRAGPRPVESAARGDLLPWAMRCLGGAVLLTLPALLLYFYAAVRYVLEIAPFLSMLAVLGFWELHRELGGRRTLRTAVMIMACALAVASIAASVLLAFSSYGEWIREHNPAFVSQFVRFFRALGRQLVP